MDNSGLIATAPDSPPDSPTAPAVWTPPPFAVRAPWWGGDLQTCRNFVMRRLSRGALPDLAPYAEEIVVLPLPDGSGDSLVGVLNRPLAATGEGAARPLAVLVHGMAGDDESAYMLLSASGLLGRGHAVLRLNLRGAGRSRAYCGGEYHAGRSDDLRAALAGLPAALNDSGLAPELTAAGVLLIGYSLGGNIVLKLLGEAGRGEGGRGEGGRGDGGRVEGGREDGEREDGGRGESQRGEALPVTVRAAVAISAPIDLAEADRRMHDPRNRFYHDRMLRRLQRNAVEPGARLSPAERQAAQAARTIFAFNDRFVAPRGGFAGARDYYRRASALPLLADIRVPTLIVHAANDPWIPAVAYRRYPWAANPFLQPHLLPGGGHVGFHTRGDRLPWYDRAMHGFFDAVLGA